MFVNIFSREIQVTLPFLGFISYFSHHGKTFDRNGKCSKRYKMDIEINLIFQTKSQFGWVRLHEGSLKIRCSNAAFCYMYSLLDLVVALVVSQLR